MDESSSGFGDESPILWKHPKLLEEHSDLNLEELHKDLLQYLKKSKTISRKDLKFYLEQVTKMNPYSQRHRWLLQKIRGLLKFILKKRAEFHDCVVKGEIIIYEKSILGEKSSVASTPIHASSSTCDVPASMLSNNNFESIDVNCAQKSSYNYSQDLFAESLHNFGRENYQIFRELTNWDENDLFKVPVPVEAKIEKVYEMHENLEEKYNSLVSLTPSLSEVAKTAIDESLKLENKSSLEHKRNPASNVDEHLDITIFDTEEINQELLNEDFEKESEDTETYVQEIVSNLLRLEVKELRSSPKFFDSKNNTMNESTGSSESAHLRTYHSAENFKIIRETCAKFRQNLERKDLDFLKDFLNSF